MTEQPDNLTQRITDAMQALIKEFPDLAIAVVASRPSDEGEVLGLQSNVSPESTIDLLDAGCEVAEEMLEDEDEVPPCICGQCDLPPGAAPPATPAIERTMKRKIVIAINGHPRAGKDTVSDMVCRRLTAEGWSAHSISSIDPIRNWLRDQGVPVDRKTPPSAT
jgi:hypothetical protein